VDSRPEQLRNRDRGRHGKERKPLAPAPLNQRKTRRHSHYHNKTMSMDQRQQTGRDSGSNHAAIGKNDTRRFLLLPDTFFCFVFFPVSVASGGRFLSLAIHQ
jgi:hypothetical protein